MRKKFAARESLGVRLSLYLAIQTLLGLAAISALVFLVIQSHLIARETRTLDEMQALVTHLASEANEAPLSIRAKNLEHVLHDQFAGREEAKLELLDGSGRPWISQNSSEKQSSILQHSFSRDHIRVREFDLSDISTSDIAIPPVRVRISLSTIRDDELVAKLGLTLASASFLGMMVVSAAAFWRVRQELESVKHLVAQIDTLDAQELGFSNRLSSDGQPSELKPLIGQFNELLGRVDTSYQQMAAFNADVAHELNTPLATLIASNEIAARQTEPWICAHHELIGSNLEELQRLRSIVRDMLFLAMAERGTLARRQHVESLAAEIHQVLDYHEVVIEEALLTAQVSGDASADIDAPLIRHAMSNLIGNATQHAYRGSSIQIAITTELEKGPVSPCNYIRVAVTNAGNEIAAENLARLFDRFFCVDNPGKSSASDNAATSGHLESVRHGLGLSIVKAIAQMHGGKPFAFSQDNLTTIGLTIAYSPTQTQSWDTETCGVGKG